jgi:hypothetical protein
MFLIEIGGVKILYTGDYSCEEDRHLMAAEVPDITPDVLIIGASLPVVSGTASRFALATLTGGCFHTCIAPQRVRTACKSTSRGRSGSSGSRPLLAILCSAVGAASSQLLPWAGRRCVPTSAGAMCRSQSKCRHLQSEDHMCQAAVPFLATGAAPDSGRVLGRS